MNAIIIMFVVNFNGLQMVYVLFWCVCDVMHTAPLMREPAVLSETLFEIHSADTEQYAQMENYIRMICIG